MSAVQHMIAVLAPWQNAFSDSTAISTTVTAVHLGSLLFSGGLAVAADRSTLRTSRSDPAAQRRQLDELHAVHRPVLIAMAVLVASGILLFTADLQTFLAAPLMWLKLALVLALMVNGAVLVRHETAARMAMATDDPPGSPAADAVWRRVRAGAVRSLVLWSATLVAGAVLVNVA